MSIINANFMEHMISENLIISHFFYLLCSFQAAQAGVPVVIIVIVAMARMTAILVIVAMARVTAIRTAIVSFCLTE